MKIVIAVTSASGAIYAKNIFSKLSQIKDQIEEGGIVFTENAVKIWEHEIDKFDTANLPFKVYNNRDFFAPFASGSAKYDCMIVCPCSMGTLARIANGISDTLITRTADVMLKERRKLILVCRETPYNLIHIQNMEKVTLSGGIILPATPSFYSKPQTIDEVISTVTDRILDIAGLNIDTFRWMT